MHTSLSGNHPINLHLRNMVDIPDFQNASDWATFIKRFKPISIYTWKRHFPFLIIVFFLFGAGYFYLAKSKLYSADYKLILIPKNNSIQTVDNWNEWIKEYISSDSTINNIQATSIKVFKERYSLKIEAEFQSLHKLRIIDSTIRLLGRRAKVVNGDIIDVKITSEDAAFNTSEILSNVAFSTAFALTVFLILVTLHTMSGKVFDVEQLDSFESNILGSIYDVGRQHDIAPSLSKPRSEYSESVRRIYTTLSSMLDQDRKVILITSAIHREGKSHFTLNLGFTAAKFGKKVVIIEADLRKPNLHAALEIDNYDSGLSVYLIGRDDISTIITKLPHQEGAYFIKSGPFPPNPAELLQNGRFEQLVAELKTKFDIILIDSPATLYSDPFILADYSDIVTLLMRINMSGLSKTIKQFNLLAQRNPKTFIVMNSTTRSEDYELFE